MITMTIAPQQAPQAAAGSVYHVDSRRSRAEFKVGKRFLFVFPFTVVGTLDRVGGTIFLDESAPENSRVDLSFAAAAITTGKARRDTHLQSADFFDVERFPEITFSSRTIEVVDPAAGHFRVTGDLSIRGIHALRDRRCAPARWPRRPQNPCNRYARPPPLRAALGAPAGCARPRGASHRRAGNTAGDVGTLVGGRLASTFRRASL